MLHLAMKAFHPAPLPFPLLHVDTTWKFREMIAFRDETARRLGLNLIVHINQDGIARGINPIASGSSVHTHVMKTEALKAGARPIWLRCRVRRRPPRRGKKPRQGTHFLVPLQGPRLGPAQSAPRTVEPVQHAHPARRNNPRVPAVELDRIGHLALHHAWRTFRSCRSTSPRSARWCGAAAPGSWWMTTACRSSPARSREMRRVRFRTLGCYPLTGAIESECRLRSRRSSRRWRPRASRSGRAA